MQVITVQAVMVRTAIAAFLLLLSNLSGVFAADMVKFTIESAGGTDGKEWIIAEGKIVPETPVRFERFVLDHQLAGGGIPVYLSSRGGSLQAGVEFGRVIRRLGMSTVVSGSTPMDTMPEGFALPDIKGAYCASACSYAFLGGINRSAPDKTVGLHQFFFAQARDEPTSIRYSGADLSNNQITIASLLEYVMEMGIDGRFLVTASRTPPKEMKWLTTDEMRDYKVIWDNREFGAWQLEAYKGGVVAVAKTNDQASVMTLFCRNQPPVRVLINTPYETSADEAYLRESMTTIFGGKYEIDPDSIKIKLDEKTLVLEFALPDMPGIEDTLQADAEEFAQQEGEPVSPYTGFVDGLGPGPRAIFWYMMPIKHFERSLKIVRRNCF